MKLKRAVSTFLTLAVVLGALLAVGVPAADTELPFKDVGAKKWYYDEVLAVWKSGLMTGTSQTRFEPDGMLTRAMFVTILGRLADAESTNSDTFPDTKKNTWYSPYVGWAVEQGIINGYEDGSFRPDEYLTREEMAACISRYIDSTGVKMPRESTAPAKFADQKKIAKWARGFVETLRRSGIVNGDQYEKYNPKANMTRAETATIILNLIDASGKAWQGYVPDAENDTQAIFGARYLYTGGLALQGAMEPSLDESGDYPYIYPVMSTRYAELSYQDDDTIGFSATAVVADLRRTPYVKICYKYTGAEEPESLSAYISQRSAEPISRADISFEKTTADGEWSTAVFTATSELLSSIGAQFGRDHGSNVQIMLKPYVGAADSARFCLAYIGLFETREAADSFKLEDEADYFRNYYRYSASTLESADKDTLEEYLDKVRERISEIKTSASEITPEDIKASGHKCYYISSLSGNDSNSGTAPDAPWRSIVSLWDIKAGGLARVAKAKEGDAVFFERGSEFYPWRYMNGSVFTLETIPNVTYGAYGDPAKPKPAFYGSFDLGGGTGEWKKTEWEDIYYFDLYEQIYRDIGESEGEERVRLFAGEAGDIGSVIFNEGEYIGVRVYPSDNENPFGDGKTTKLMGKMGNCEDYYISGGTSCNDPADALRNNLEFLHDYGAGRVYLKCTWGDPSEYFTRIDLARNCYNVTANKNVRLDNICSLYTSWITIDLGDGSMATNCEAGYAGGCTGSVGTGIGGYGKCESLVVNNCYIHDVEDGPMGTQNTADYSDDPFSAPELNGVVLTNNVVTTSQNLVELFSTFRHPDEDGVLGVNKIRNAVVKGNYGVYLGYGYPRKVELGVEGLGIHNWYYGEMVDCEFSENTLICCAGKVIGAHVGSDNNERGWKMFDNTYVLNPNHSGYLRGGDGICEYTNLNMSFYCSFGMGTHINQRNLTYFASIGIDTTSKFYALDYESEAEADGYYVTTGYRIEHGSLPK